MDQSVVLTILRLTDTYRFQLDLPAQGARLGASPGRPPVSLVDHVVVDPTLRIQLTDAINTAVEALRSNKTVQAAGKQQRQNTIVERPLRELGSLLYRLVLPASIQHALYNLNQALPLVLATDDTELPWELLYDGSAFLALQRSIGRQMLLAGSQRNIPPTSHTQLSYLIITNPTSDLPEAERESEKLMELFDTAPEKIKTKLIGNKHATRFAIQQALAGGNYDVIHYSGHADPGALVLADGKLSADEIQATLHGRPFVFLNACRSVQQATASLESPYAGLTARNLATAFLQGGAIGFVGTLWPIFDDSSRYFAEWFYALTADGNSIGEVLRRTRKRMYLERQADPLWASYVFYGDPNLQLMRGPQRGMRAVALLTVQMKEGKSAFAQAGEAQATQLEADFSDLVAGIAQRYEGVLSATLNHLWQISFGLSKTHEDDSTRAIRAAQDILHTSHTFYQAHKNFLSHPLQLGLGIGQGEALVNTRQTLAGAIVQMIGGPIDRSVTLALNASVGEIWIDQGTQQLVQRAYQCEPINGPNLPITFRVGNARRVTPATPLIGREQALTQLQGWWRETLAGQGRLVAVVGEAGLGKSRLVQAFQAAVTAESTRALAVACTSYEQAVSLALLAQLIRTLAQIESGDDEATQRTKLTSLIAPLAQNNEDSKRDTITLLSHVIGLAAPATWLDKLTSDQQKQKLTVLLQAILRQQASQQPFILVLEDLHWADEASLTLLAPIVAGITRWRILVVVSYRPDWENAWKPQGQYHLLTLTELDKAARHSLFETLLPTVDVAPALIEPLLTFTGGNPLYIEEMVKHLQASGALRQVGTTWTWHQTPTAALLPKTVEQLLRARFDTLDALRREVAQKAAVIGERFEYVVLEQLEDAAGRSQLESTLETLVTHALIDPYEGWMPPDITYSFRHSLMQQTIYLTLSESVRRPLHRLVAQVLVAKKDDLESIAYHYEQSDDPIQAIVYGLRANQAKGKWNPTLALQRYDTILALLENLADQPLIDLESKDEIDSGQQLRWKLAAYTGKGDLLSTQGRNNEAIRWYERALELAEYSPNRIAQKADLYHKIAKAQQAKGDFVAGQATVARGLRLVGTQKSSQAGRLQIWGGFLHFNQGRLTEALAACTLGITILEQIAERDQPLAQGYNLRGLLYHDLGRPQEAADSFAESVALYKQIEDVSGQVRAYNNRAVLYQDWGRWDEALHDLAQATDLARKTEEAWWQAGSLINQAEIYRYQGELAQAQAANQQALQIGKEHDLAEIAGLAQMNLGICSAKLGDLISAEEKLATAITIFTEHTSEHLTEAQGHLAELRLQQNQPELALALAEEALQHCEETIQIGRLHRVLGRACHQLQRLEEARAHLDKSVAALQTRNFRYELALTWLECALLDQTLATTTGDADGSLHKQAIQFCEQAIASFTELGAKLDLAYALNIYQSL